jgi:hypothetical protein
MNPVSRLPAVEAGAKSVRTCNEAYLKVAEDLFSRTEDIRTLTMLALSARG